MLGQSIDDPEGIEGTVARLPGLGLLPIHTTMTAAKQTRQVTFRFDGKECRGYEIHQGVSDTSEAVLQAGHCIGTYIHGFLDNAPVIDYLLGGLCAEKCQPVAFDYQAYKEEQYNRLADHVRRYVDMDRIYQILTDE
jgi:adenosylcobyric acid synthase